MEKYEDVCKGILKAIENHTTYTTLMSCNDRPTIEDGENLLVLLSVIHDELKYVVRGENNFEDYE